MDYYELDLDKELSDSVFDVHEEIFDEDSLFKIHLMCDDILKKSEKARLDGVFKIKLAQGLKGSGSTLQDFWLKMKNAPKFLHSLFLKCDQKSSYVMENQSRKVSMSTKFSEAVKRHETFDISTTNCCMQALNTGGPKGAVKHFYENIQAKATVLETDVVEASFPRTTKRNYQERQSYLRRKDMSFRCDLIEGSMGAAKYDVQDDITSVQPDPESSCTCPRCRQSLLSTSMQCLNPINLKDDGDGDNCALYFNGIEESSERFLYVTKNFAMSHLCHLNMLTDLDCYYHGISFPYLYLGGLHSFFPLHVEDMSLFSLNYNHMGYPKLIIVVAPSEVSKVSLLLSHYGLTNIHRNCIHKLTHKAMVVFPQWLLKHQIQFKIIIQYPGEFVLFAPNAAHTGGNMGPNLAEACNFGTPYWLPFGSVAAHSNCNCVDAAVHMDVTQLIKDHRKELLKYHLNKSMWTDYEDELFRKSIIAPQVCLASSVTLQAASSVPTSRSGTKKSSRPPLSCPVEGCFKKYIVPNRKNMEKHINNLHKKAAAVPATWVAVDALFPKHAKGAVLRKVCEECGCNISVYSNKHKGGPKCLRNQKSRSNASLRGEEEEGNAEDEEQDNDEDDGIE